MESHSKPSHENHGFIALHLFNYSSLSAIIGVFLLVLYFSLGEIGRGHYIIDKWELQENKNETIAVKQKDTSQINEYKSKYHDIYTARKSHYESTLTSLSTIINGLGICCLISILALYYETRESISIAGVQLPFKAVFLILPILMLYLWLSFGFTFFSALDSRQVCYVAAVRYESLSNLSTGDDIQFNRDYSMIHTLEDRGLIDGSTHVFNGLYSDEVYSFFFDNNKLSGPKKISSQNRLLVPYKKIPDPVVTISLYLIFGTLLGLSVGFILTLLIRFRHLPDTNNRIARLLVLSCFIMIVLSITGFLFRMPYFLPFIAYVWIIAAIVIFMYINRINKELSRLIVSSVKK